MVAGEKEVLLEVGGFGVDRGVEMTMIQAYMNVQKSDLGGGDVPGELDGIAAVEVFKELGEELGPWGQRRKMSDKTHPEAGFLDSGVKEILFKETHEQVGIGRGHTGQDCPSHQSLQPFSLPLRNLFPC